MTDLIDIMKEDLYYDGSRIPKNTLIRDELADISPSLVKLITETPLKFPGKIICVGTAEEVGNNKFIW